jgi:hypothetical protein
VGKETFLAKVVKEGDTYREGDFLYFSSGGYTSKITKI